MGITRLKKLLSDDLSRAFTSRELRHYLSSINIELDLYSLTGYPDNSPIPRREAALQVVEYLHKTNKLIHLLSLYLQSAEKGFKGERLVFNNLKPMLFEINECGFKYSRELGKVILSEADGKRMDWGFLKSGTIYDFCFMSIDICKNSMMVRKYDSDTIRKTYINFKKFAQDIIESYKGRIWLWEGDGGLAVFHLGDLVNQTVMSAIKILSNMTVFNCTQNYIDDDILIRIAVTSGSTQYNKDISSINSDVINEVRKVEKFHTIPMTISITKHTFQHIDVKVRKYLKLTNVNDLEVYQLKLPFTGALN